MSDYVPCFELPPRSELEIWWRQTSFGGVSTCVQGFPKLFPGCTLANCVGWCWGRFCQIAGEVVEGVPNINAGDWYDAAAPYFERGPEPALGAVLCLSGGHVATVEQIAEDGSWILCSESNWAGETFVMQYRYRVNNWQLTVQGFQGFIYNPYAGDTPTRKKKSSFWWKYRTATKNLRQNRKLIVQ